MDLTPSQLVWAMTVREIVQAGDQASSIHAATLGARGDAKALKSEMKRLGA